MARGREQTRKLRGSFTLAAKQALREWNLVNMKYNRAKRENRKARLARRAQEEADVQS